MATINPYRAPNANVQDQQDEEFQEPRMLGVSGRLGRVRYIGYTFAITLLVIVVTGILTAVLMPVSEILGMIVMGLGYLFMLVVQFMLLIQRAHDFNTTGWLSLISFIPLAVFVFWFVPGTDGPNRWGPQVKPNSTKTILLALVLPILAVVGVGILAAVALPAYQDYVNRAQQMQEAQPH